ncbi:hypothetical protein ABPG74_018033 [Tetrahymena malaccensis]
MVKQQSLLSKEKTQFNKNNMQKYKIEILLRYKAYRQNDYIYFRIVIIQVSVKMIKLTKLSLTIIQQSINVQNQSQNLKDQAQQNHGIQQNQNNRYCILRSKQQQLLQSKRKSEEYQKYKEQYKQQYQKKTICQQNYLKLKTSILANFYSSTGQINIRKGKILNRCKVKKGRKNKDVLVNSTQNQMKSRTEDQLFDESNLTFHTSQKSAEISQFELQDLNPKLTLEMSMSRVIIDLINQYRKQNSMLQLQFSPNIMPTFEYNPRKIAYSEYPF